MRRENVPIPGKGEHLTSREQEVLELVYKGLSNREIGEAIGISVPTVKLFLTHLFTKLGAHTRLAAINQARAFGILDKIGIEPRGKD